MSEKKTAKSAKAPAIEDVIEYFAKANAYEPEEDSYIVAWALSEVKAGGFDSAINHYKYLYSFAEHLLMVVLSQYRTYHPK